MEKNKKKIYFIFHWVAVLSLIGLIATALGGALFFSKKAIMESFSYSLPALNINIDLVNQLFIAKIERRFNWDWHFYSGLLFGIDIFFFILFYLKNMLLFCIACAFISGSRLYARLWIPLNDDFFYYLKMFHRYSVYTFIFLLSFHVLEKIKLQITGGCDG